MSYHVIYSKMSNDKKKNNSQGSLIVTDWGHMAPDILINIGSDKLTKACRLSGTMVLP